jgi:hypothetical protein
MLADNETLDVGNAHNIPFINARPHLLLRHRGAREASSFVELDSSE